jgi:hypothetical protein
MPDMFKYADTTDYFLMLVGSVGAAGNGVLITLFSLFFGDLVQDFDNVVFRFVLTILVQVNDFSAMSVSAGNSTETSTNGARIQDTLFPIKLMGISILFYSFIVTFLSHRYPPFSLKSYL